MKSVELQELGHFISGRIQLPVGGRMLDVLNPTSNEKIATVADGTREDVYKAVHAARNAFREGGWGETSIEKRSDILHQAARGIEKNAEDLSFMETVNTGIPISQTRALVKRAAEYFRFFADMAGKVLQTAFPVSNDFLNYTLRKPVGVAGLITPWNSPISLEAWKIAPCLAAGNTCVLKPSEWTPMSANRLALILQEAGVPDGVFNIVHGLGEGAGATLVSHPGVQLISFTGETATGKEILRNGAFTLKRFSMELGGKNPAVVFDDADLDRALDSVIYMAYSLNGERCTATSRVLLQHTIFDEFIGKLADRIAHIKVGDPFSETTELGPLVRPEHWQRVAKYIGVGINEGAMVVYGGKRPPGFPNGNYLEPTLMTGVDPAMKIAQDEIFGPVLVGMQFKDEREAIHVANDVIYGLTSYVWTKDIARAHRVAAAVDCGLTWINSHNVRDLRTPFGGTKASGVGREGGSYSFDFYTETKTVHVSLSNTPPPAFGVPEQDPTSGPSVSPQEGD